MVKTLLPSSSPLVVGVGTVGVIPILVGGRAGLASPSSSPVSLRLHSSRAQCVWRADARTDITAGRPRYARGSHRAFPRRNTPHSLDEAEAIWRVRRLLGEVVSPGIVPRRVRDGCSRHRCTPHRHPACRCPGPGVPAVIVLVPVSSRAPLSWPRRRATGSQAGSRTEPARSERGGTRPDSTRFHRVSPLTSARPGDWLAGRPYPGPESVHAAP